MTRQAVRAVAMVFVILFAVAAMFISPAFAVLNIAVVYGLIFLEDRDRKE